MPSIHSLDAAPWAALAVALGIGLLIGIERERHKGQGDDRQAAGIRSFTIAALAGALCAWLGVLLSAPAIVVAGIAVAGAFALLAYHRTRSADPGLTTELALFVTFLLGVAAVASVTLAAAVGTVVAILLASRARLQHMATQLIAERELYDGLVLAALALIGLPLVSRINATGWVVSPYVLLRLLIVLLALQAAGHIAQRLLGESRGLFWAGLSSGFVSSTATIAALGTKQRDVPSICRAAAAGALASGVATWILAGGLVVTAAPAVAVHALIVIGPGAMVTLAAGRLIGKRQPGASVPTLDAHGRMFQLGPTAVIALVLAITSWAAQLAQARFGDGGVWLTTAIAAVVDAHAVIGATAGMVGATKLSAHTLWGVMLLAIAINTTTRSLAAFAMGGRRFGTWVSFGLWCGWLAAGAGAWCLL